MIGRTLGRYKILEQIGGGGMGVVYRAHDERLERDVAVKVLPEGALVDEAARRRFRQEALALAKLSHPNICVIYDFDTQDGVDFLAMEYVVGQSLAQKLVVGPLPEKEVMSFGAQVTAALEEAHERGIVHRDLKPGNILVTPKGQAKVLDFGLAQLLRPHADPAATQTFAETQGLKGTLPYMAPEQLRGETPDARADIYSLGCVFYEMATGRRAFPEDSAPRLTDAILHQAPVGPRAVNSRVSPQLEAIILKLLDKDPERRYQAARELRVDLERLRTPTTSVPETRVKKSIAKSVVAAALGVVILAAIAFGLDAGGIRSRLSGVSGRGEIRSIAVLPLENLSHDPEEEYFADGMTEALITEFAQIRALRVTSRTSVMQYKRAQKTLPQIAKELDVAAVVEGSVQRSGDRVEITVQLIQASNDEHLWAKSYQRNLRDVLDLQREVARTIAGEIRVAVTPQEKEKLAQRRSVNPDAYQAYLKGRYYWNQRSETSIKRGREYFEQAIEKDPTYAPALSGLADVADALSWYGFESPQSFVRSRQLALKAIALDDSLAEGHASLAMGLFYSDWDGAGAEKEFLRAIELDPNYANAHHWYGDLLGATGRHQEAISSEKRALEIEPVSLIMNTWLARRYYFGRQMDAASAQCRKALELNGNFAPALYQMGLIDIEQKNYGAAIAEFQKAKELSGGATIYIAALARGYAASGQKDQALKIYELLKHPGEKYVSPYWMAQIVADLGRKDDALQWLEAAWAGRAVWMVMLSADPAFDPLRSDPRFQSFVRRIHLLQ
jgi:eukaryotic-like serine/threonine-protein kinase